MQFTFGDKREVYLLDESVPPVTKKERRWEGKRSIGPRMKYGHANLKSFCPHTNGRCSIDKYKSCQMQVFTQKLFPPAKFGCFTPLKTCLMTLELFFIIFYYANACTSKHLLVEIHNTGLNQFCCHLIPNSSLLKSIKMKGYNEFAQSI